MAWRRRERPYPRLGVSSVPIDYSCFISYRHGQKPLMRSFIEQLVKALEAYVEPHLHLPIFWDRSSLEGGDLYNEQFARALASSVCMIAVYTPTYFDRKNTYCTREYRAMELIEKSRLANVTDPDLKNRGLIIPVIFRGPLPSYVTQRRVCKYDFSRFMLHSDDIGRHEQYAAWFDEIGQRVRRLYNHFEQAGTLDLPIEGFSLPAEREIVDVLEQINPPLHPPFPGRRLVSDVSGAAYAT